MIGIVHTMTHSPLFLHLSQAQVAHHTHLSQVQDLVIVHQEIAYLVTALQVYHQRDLQVSDPARLLVALFHLTTVMTLNYHETFQHLMGTTKMQRLMSVNAKSSSRKLKHLTRLLLKEHILKKMK